MKGLEELNIRIKLFLLLLLSAGTVCSLALGVYLRHHTGESIYLFLNWDMFLAWVPAGLALLLDMVFVYFKQPAAVRRLLLIVLGLMWLFFYPNSAYLITDMLHPFNYYHPVYGSFLIDIEFWYHLFLFFSAAMIGLFLGIYSLYSVQTLVSQAFGRIVGWVFAVGVLLLSSLGIFIGRFIRWNSWDVLSEPLTILKDTHFILTNAGQLRLLIPFTSIIFVLTLLTYSFVYSFTYLKRS
ncbi:DUF1361 domain-containing protein [Paenibacillus solisilvae]|uniref:DUF1361 domain-containing protein n=1 Tax=Paenibacillus solisilvae TaxID=2486751 RepID=A0ABW0VWK3_9BACL